MIVAVGEGMLELRKSTAGWDVGHGGDVLNTAIHLSRLGKRVAFMSALGSDPVSLTLREAWAGEGLDLSLVRTVPDRHPGLYAIATDAAGERSFTYWRDDSAARRMFDRGGADPDPSTIGLLYFSLISMAILPVDGRERLLGLCRRVRAAGGSVAFDGNYRPALWDSVEAAREAHSHAIAVADIGLPTRDDEQALTGIADIAAIDAYWRRRGAGEVVVKLGPEGCFADGRIWPVPAPVAASDTTGAGDAFNAGYLARRLSGRSLEESIVAGHRLAGWVVTRPGGTPAMADDSPYAALMAT